MNYLKEKLTKKPILQERVPVIINIQTPLIIDKRDNKINRKELLKNIEPIIVSKIIPQRNISTHLHLSEEPLHLEQQQQEEVQNKDIEEPLQEEVQNKDIEEPLQEEVQNKDIEPLQQEFVIKRPRPKKIPKSINIEEEIKDLPISEQVKEDITEAYKESEMIYPDQEPKPESSEKIIIKRKRITKPPPKGVAILGPETNIKIEVEDLKNRLPVKPNPVNILVSDYYMNNREIFVNFINSIFQPYKEEIDNHKEEISCDNKSSNFSLLTHQKIVRDYINLYTPYRGLLLYHGLGSGKTCTSIAIAEGMKSNKRIVVLLPASLRANYIEELKKCGDLLYKRNQFWEWISTQKNPSFLEPISALLHLPVSYIEKNKGAWFVNVKKPSNYDTLSNEEKQSLENQLNIMIQQKYFFINYNGLRNPKLKEMTKDFTINPFDDATIIIDEAHNLISRIVNKVKNEKNISENKRGEKERLPVSMASKLYEYLLSAKNAKIILLTGTPVINYPNEFGILFNILRGYIKTWKFSLNVNTNQKIDRERLRNLFRPISTLDYLDYSPSSKILTITRNPFGFINSVTKNGEYQGVRKSKGDFEREGYLSEDDFERMVVRILRENNIEVVPDSIEIINKKALPDTLESFENNYIDYSLGKLKNVDALKRRILGLSSFFRSAQENLLPRYKKQIGVDYFVVQIPMSDFQFKIYESARIEERKLEKDANKKVSNDLAKSSSSTYRIFSRLFCNYVMPDRPMPKVAATIDEKEITDILKEANKKEKAQDTDVDQVGEIEGDQLLNNIGGIDYKKRLDDAIHSLEEHSEEYLSKQGLQTYSPKFLHILENIQDPEHIGLHLVYSQFRTAEGIGIFSLVLEANGFARFLMKNNNGNWEIEESPADRGKPKYALYTGTETTEEKEIIRHIYNGEWEQIPNNIRVQLEATHPNNNLGEIIKVLMITSSGSEGINLRNTRYVHIVEPYWHPVRLVQVIGRARRICSHKNLPVELQTVEVFIYLMKFTVEQLASSEAVELKRHDLSKGINSPKVPFTSDQYLYEISQIKENLTNQLTDAIKESSFDCNIYSGEKCFNFGSANNTAFSYLPDYMMQQSDTIVQANKKRVEWVGKELTIANVKYVYRELRPGYGNVYDYNSYQNALLHEDSVPVQIGTLEQKNGEYIFKQI